MKRITPRTLVAQRLGNGPKLTRGKTRQAMDAVRLDGWQPSYYPTPEDGDRVLVLLREGHAFAPLFRALEDRPALRIPIVELQRLVARAAHRDHVDLRSTTARDVMTRHGLILVRFEGEDVHIASSSPELAKYVNYPRYSRPRKGFKVPLLIRDVLGLANEPRRVTGKARWATASLLDEYGINASDLLEAEGFCKLVPDWRIDDIEFPTDCVISLDGEARHA